MPPSPQNHLQVPLKLVKSTTDEPMLPINETKWRRCPLVADCIPVAETGKVRKRYGHRRNVSFGDFLVVEPTIHFTEYTQAEVASTWYHPNELKGFKTERKETAMRIDLGEADDSDCVRGVESLTRPGSQMRYEDVVVGVNSVLDEQELQDLDGKENPEMLARIYGMNTVRSQALARERALSDHEAILSESAESI